MFSSFSITTRKGDEYRIMLIDADISLLNEQVRDFISSKELDISEIMIQRIKGGESTTQDVLHTIAGRLADLFADNSNLVLFYSCDDINPIPNRNTRGANRSLSVQEYRSKLFSHMFNNYIDSHQVSGIINTPIIIEGVGYVQYMHLISREKHLSIVNLIKDDVIKGWGK